MSDTSVAITSDAITSDAITNEAWFKRFVDDNYGELQNQHWLEKKVDYYSSQVAPDDLKALITYLSNCFMIRDSLIASWRWSPEWEESVHSPIAYYLVNLLVYNNATYIPPDLFTWLTSFTRKPVFDTATQQMINLRLGYLKAAFYHTDKNIIPLNNIIRTHEIPLSALITGIIPAQSKAYITRTDSCIIYPPDDIIYTFTKLYGDNGHSMIIFSGISHVICSNDQLSLFLEGTASMFFPPRSWSLDLRVAVHFSPEREPDVISGNIPFKVIFMLRTDKVCYVSPNSSWEAEVFKPAGNYYYKEHFMADYNEIIGNAVKHTKKVNMCKLLVIVIEKIEPIDILKKTEKEFDTFIENLFEGSGLAEADSQTDLEEDEETVKAHWDEVMQSFKGIAVQQKAAQYNQSAVSEGGQKKRKTRRRKLYRDTYKHKKPQKNNKPQKHKYKTYRLKNEKPRKRKHTRRAVKK